MPYIATRPLRVGGNNYAVGDVIPGSNVGVLVDKGHAVYQQSTDFPPRSLAGPYSSGHFTPLVSPSHNPQSSGSLVGATYGIGLHLFPFYNQYPVTLDQIGIKVNAITGSPSADTRVKFKIYQIDDPSSSLDATQLSSAETGLINITTVTDAMGDLTSDEVVPVGWMLHGMIVSGTSGYSTVVGYSTTGSPFLRAQVFAGNAFSNTVYAQIIGKKDAAVTTTFPETISWDGLTDALATNLPFVAGRIA